MLLAAAAVFAASCSIPDLTSPECEQATGVVRELFSYHLGNDLRFGPEDEKFMTPELAASLKNNPAGVDPVTKTDPNDPPKAFRVGRCKSAGGRPSVEVLLFWKTDTRSEQRELDVETVKQGDKWLVDKIAKR